MNEIKSFRMINKLMYVLSVITNFLCISAFLFPTKKYYGTWVEN